MAKILEQLSLQSANEAHLFVLKRFEEDHELAEKLQPDFYGRPSGWITEIEQARHMGWVGRLAEEYVGFVDLALEANESLAYLSVYVVPGYRGIGVGSSMVRMVADRLGELELQGLLAQTEADNWPVRRCLQSAGFRVLGSEESTTLLYALDIAYAYSADD